MFISTFFGQLMYFLLEKSPTHNNKNKCTSADTQVLSDVLQAAALCFWIFCFAITSCFKAQRIPGMIKMTVVKFDLAYSLIHSLTFPSNFSHAGARVNTNTPCSHIYEHTRRQSVFLISKVHGFPQGCWNNGIKKYWRGELPMCIFWCLCLFMYACLHTVADPIVSSSKGNLKIGVGLQCPALNLI